MYGRNFSYNFNDELAGTVDSFSGWRGYRFTMIRRTEHKVLILEQEAPIVAFGSPKAWDSGRGWFGVLSRRHAGKSNQGFADGHVEQLDSDALEAGGFELFVRYKVLEYNF
jgi:prepilin-type processing-associated H-X9-DG protein